MKIFSKLSFGIYFLIFVLLCIFGLFLLCRFLSNREYQWLRYEAENCVQELETTKQNCQKRLGNCSDLAGTLWIVSQKDYNIENYNCLNYSQELKNRLEEIGIKSSIVKGKWNGEDHYWIVIWIESVEGNFIKPDEDYTIEKIE